MNCGPHAQNADVVNYSLANGGFGGLSDFLTHDCANQASEEDCSVISKPWTKLHQKLSLKWI